MNRSALNIVWLKRDLRLRDHAPLEAAIWTGIPTILWYCFEPTLFAQNTYALRHGRFIWESLQDLKQALLPYQGKLWITHGHPPVQLDLIAQHFDIEGLYSHQETGPKWTYDRDLKVKAYCQQQGIQWKEFPQDGVIRALQNRENWERDWYRYMQSPLAHPKLETWKSILMPSALKLALTPSPLPKDISISNPIFQPGGETNAWKYLSSFLQERGKHYVSQLSHPKLSRFSCSRLSPYLAHGCVSAREVYQLSNQTRKDRPWGKMLSHFHERLWWRSHYIQKLETEWQIEFEPINRGMAALERPLDGERLAAFASGQTGFPLVDASIRCLQANGYLNFRMRAMLATFASFALELPWQATAEVLARLFLDYEPGIHFAQIQMQAGMSAYHPLRIFHPTLQAQKYDPDGTFIHEYVPELASIPAPDLFQPWQVPVLAQQLYQCVIGKDYPSPIVPYDQTISEAKAHYWTIRQRPETRLHLSRLWRRHCLPRNRQQYEAEMEKWKREA